MPASPPLVSIVIATYNRADFLAEAIDSVLEQDHTAVECVVVDDGSTDDTPDLLRAYEGRIVVLTQENRGQPRAVNRGFRKSQGALLGVLGSDERLYPGAIAHAVAALVADPQAAVAHGDVELTDERDDPIMRYGVGDLQLVDCLRFHAGPATTGMLFRRTAIEQVGGWNPTFPIGPDFDFWLRLGLCGRYAHVPRVLGNFRQHPGSITAAREDDAARAHEYVRATAEFLAREGLPPAIDEAVRAEAMRTAYFCAGIIAGGDINGAGERFAVQDRVAAVLQCIDGAELPHPAR